MLLRSSAELPRFFISRRWKPALTHRPMSRPKALDLRSGASKSVLALGTSASVGDVEHSVQSKLNCENLNPLCHPKSALTCPM